MIIQKQSKILRQASYMSGALLFLLVFFTIFPLYVVPDNTEATTKNPTPSTVTLAFTRTTASATLNVTSLDGSFATSASGEEAAFNVTTNNATGYTLNLRLSDSYNYNTATNSNATQTDMASSGGLLESISSMVTASNFSTSTTYNNKWGILPNKYNSSANTNYYPATTAGFTMDATSAANTTSNNYTVGLGVRANYEVPAGTYNSNYIVATVVANAVTYAINYYDPSGEATGMPAVNPQTGTISTGTTSTSVTLASAPTRTGYDFIGWCSGTSAAVSNITTTNGVDSCSSTVYDAGQSFGINATGSSPDTYYLHAMWEVHYTTMQEAVPLDCGDDLKDARDGNIYSTASIINLCWMTKNLDLAGGTELTSTDSNVLSDYTLPASSTTGFSDNNTAYVYNSNNTTCDGTNPCYSYYSFVAASAGTGGTSVSSGDVSQDICPAGWRLPTKTEFSNLRNFMANTNVTGRLQKAPFLGVLAGKYADDSYSSTFASSSYWLSTISNSTKTWPGDMAGTTSLNGVDKETGFAVRCVMKGSYTHKYMQDQTSSTLATHMPSTDSYVKLYDKRDGKPYIVAKLADGKYWMLDNLSLDILSVIMPGTKVLNNYNWMANLTNASETSLRYLGGTNTRDPSTDPTGNFATAGVSDTWANSFSAPYVNMASKDSTGNANEQWGNGSHKFGGYYNYCAATAGSYCYGNGTSAGTSVGNATEDICPAGWRMPTNGATTGEYWQLCTAIKGSDCVTDNSDYESMTASATTSLQNKLSTPLAGYFYSGSQHLNYGDGTFWSSTRSNEGGQFVNSLNISSTEVYPQGSSARGYGLSIRCLATDTYTLTVTLGTGVDSVTVGTTTLTSSGSVTLNQGVSYPISMTFDTGYEFDSWSATSGTLGSASTNPTTYTIGSANATLTAGAKAVNYMQDQNSSTLATLMPNNGDSTTLYDKRDGADYTIKKINGQYWMTQNLRFTDTSVPASTSNVTSDKTLTYYSLKSSNNGGFGAYTNHCDSTNGYNYACIYDSGSTTTGVWYNYYAATAGTISTDSNTDPATSDICPAGWHLPTGPSTTADTDFNILVGNTTSGFQDPTAGLIAFSAVAGGYYYSGSLSGTGYGNWWPATAVSATSRYFLRYSSSTGQFTGNTNNSRYYGIFIRCLAVDTYDLTVSYGTGVASVIIDGTTVSNGSTVTLNSGIAYPINMTFDTGYEFDSWSATSGTIGSASTNPTTYTIGSANATLTASAKLSYTIMQNATLANCGETMADARDGKAYTTAKIGNRCWMTANLDLAGGTALSADNTDVDASYISSFSTSNNLTKTGNTIVLPASSTTGFNTANYSYVYNSGSTTCGNNSPCYSYYSWDAATLGSGRSISTDNENAPYSICPKGWHLPTTYYGRDSTTDFRALMITYGGSDTVQIYTPSTTPTGNTIYSAIGPNTTANFLRAGYYDAGSFLSGGANGYYWSATSGSDTNSARDLNIVISSVNPVLSSLRYFGSSVRCVMDLPYMQDQTAASLAELMPNSGDSAALRDERDKQIYTIAKIGNDYWMTKNLNLAGETELTPADSNVTTSYTLPASANSGWSDTTAIVYNSGSTTCGNNSPCYSYYSFVAATAGTGGSSLTTGEATSDICPKSWRLPTTAEYTALTTTYSTGNALSAAPFNMVYGGYYDRNSNLSSGGTYGSYWTSSASSSTQAYRMYASSSTVTNPVARKRQGSAVRCVFKLPYMQDQTASTLATLMPNNGDSTTLYDKRDGADYTVKKINGQYWMTQNLRYLGDTGSTAGTMTIGNSNSNVTNKSITLYSLNSSNAGNFGAYADHCGSTYGYNYACVYDSGSTTTGVWYNYYAATAGTISTDSNSTAATSDICPAGWHLPTGPNTTAGTDFNILVGNTTSGAQDPTAGLTAFSAVTGGNYINGSLYLTGYGYWWSATASTATNRYTPIYYNSSTGQFTGSSGSPRYNGIFIRCMRS